MVRAPHPTPRGDRRGAARAPPSSRASLGGRADSLVDEPIPSPPHSVGEEGRELPRPRPPGVWVDYSTGGPTSINDPAFPRNVVTGKKGRKPTEPPKPPNGLAFPIECVTDHCDAQTMFIHPGNAPFESGLFLDHGWVAMSDPGERTVLYMCPKCIAKTIAEVEEEMTSARRPIRRQVSG
jgi:hypothetical protein